jgi:site-specific DNA-cytosine methylase
MAVYYNENDPRAAAWLRELIKMDLIAPGDVDERSIEDVTPADVKGYTQCHWFAGIGIWSYALRLAGWPDDRPAWTGSCPCFAEGVLILTEFGYLPIEEVRVGDMVLTHRGRWRPVTAIMTRENADTYQVKAQGCPDIITPSEHPFYARKQRRVGHKSIRELQKPVWINAGNMAGNYCAQVIPNHRPDHRTNEFWWIVGRYLADGWRVIPKSENTARRVYICCAKDERGELKSRIEAAGLRARCYNEQTVCKFAISNSELYEFLGAFGDKASGKRIPRVALELDSEKAGALLEGYFSGDGYRDNCGKNWQATTVSQSLALGIALIAQRVYGRIASVQRTTRKRYTTIEGRVVQQHDSYKITIPDSNRSAVREGDYGWKLVRSVTHIGHGRVFNISVEEDESYCAGGAVVHNCTPFSSAGKGLGFNDERHLWPAWYWLIDQCRPVAVFGEQVSSRDGLAWLDLVQADMEGAGYALGVLDTCAASVGAPHIRQRLYFVAYPRCTDGAGWRMQRSQRPDSATGEGQPVASGIGSLACHLAHAESGGETAAQQRRQLCSIEQGGGDGLVAHAETGRGWRDGRALGPVGSGGLGAVGNTHSARLAQRTSIEQIQQEKMEPSARETTKRRSRPGPANGFWRDAQWLYCRDGKYRAVKPCTSALVAGPSARVGRSGDPGAPIDADNSAEARVMRLRGYGNCIVAPQAAAFIAAAMDIIDHGLVPHEEAARIMSVAGLREQIGRRVQRVTRAVEQVKLF